MGLFAEALGLRSLFQNEQPNFAPLVMSGSQEFLTRYNAQVARMNAQVSLPRLRKKPSRFAFRRLRKVKAVALVKALSR